MYIVSVSGLFTNTLTSEILNLIFLTSKSMSVNIHHWFLCFTYTLTGFRGEIGPKFPVLETQEVADMMYTSEVNSNQSSDQ